MHAKEKVNLHSLNAASMLKADFDQIISYIKSILISGPNFCMHYILSTYFIPVKKYNIFISILFLPTLNYCVFNKTLHSSETG